MSSGTWDAATYDRISASMEALGRQVIARMELAGDEVVLDAGCGSGRVTEVLVDALPRGRVIAVDNSPEMIEVARGRLGGRADVVTADLMELQLGAPVDAALCTATLHWIDDHDGVFARLHAALRPGGRLFAQCGGDGNIERIRAIAARVGATPPFAAYLDGWRGPWNFPGADETAERLGRAGFSGIRCWLEASPYAPEDPREYIANMVVGPHRERLPEELREPFTDLVMEALPAPPLVDYVRLNIEARA
jgi:trans-aconitate 2-methyltransferase